MADENENRISPSQKEIYSKLLTIAGKYMDTTNEDYLRTGEFGWILESMAAMIRDSTYHKNMIYNESFLNTAVIPSSVYNYAKMFNVEVQKATPAYATVQISIPEDYLSNLLKDSTVASSYVSKYGNIATLIGAKSWLVLDKESPINAGDYLFALEHSILILCDDSGNYSAKYVSTEYTSTSFQELNENYNLDIVNDGENIIIIARVYQYQISKISTQILSSSFLNKVQTYNFENQFCGAALFYLENTSSSKTQIPLVYSDLSATTISQCAFYNLNNENQLEIQFKYGDSYFMPATNSTLVLYIYTTNGQNVPSTYTGDATITFSDTDLKSLPLVINFNPSNLIGGKDAPSLSEIKQNVIDAISTRNTITTQSDLNKYFSILTSLIEDINDGKVTFIKKRDDVIRRIYNSYLLLRDNTDDSTSSVASYGYLSPCVPTTTKDVILATNETSFNESFAKFDSDGNYISGDVVSGEEYYFCPFDIHAILSPTRYVKYTYSCTDDTVDLKYYKYADSTSNLVDTTDDANVSTDLYMIPVSASVYRGFNSSGEIDSYYTLSLTFTTNFSLNSSDSDYQSLTGDISITNSEGLILSVTPTGSSSTLSSGDTNTYKTTLKAILYVRSEDTDDFNFIRLARDSTESNSLISYYDSENLLFDLSSLKIGSYQLGIKYQTSSALTFFSHLDNIMSSSLETAAKVVYTETAVTESTFVTLKASLYTEADGVYSLLATDAVYSASEVYYTKGIDSSAVVIQGIDEIPLVSSKFFSASTTSVSVEDKMNGFIKQLFSYISILKENTDKLETSTFFNLKFYNTSDVSHFYNTPTTNLHLGLNITLSISSERTDLEKEIRAYVRKIVDKSNKNELISVSQIEALLHNDDSYGSYISHIQFTGLNDTLTSTLQKVSDDTTNTTSYAPEWLNLDMTDIDSLITFSYES